MESKENSVAVDFLENTTSSVHQTRIWNEETSELSEYESGGDSQEDLRGVSGDVQSISASSSSIQGVGEQPWSVRHEFAAKEWQQSCEKNAETHVNLGIFMQFLFQVFSFPVYTMPLVVSQLQDHGGLEFEDRDHQVLLTFSAVLAGINTMCNFGKRSEKHFNMESQFSRLATLIGIELEKKQKERQNPNVFMVTIVYQLESLHAMSPGVAAAKCAYFFAKIYRLFWRVMSCKKCHKKKRQ